MSLPARGSGHPDRRGIGLPVLAVLGLAALAVPRAIAHDLDLVPQPSMANTLLAAVPLVIWVVVAVLWSRRPLLSLVVAGGIYGVALAVVHNISWAAVWGDTPPRLGGNLTGVLAPGMDETLLRGATTVSSLLTGLATGLICGLIAWGVQALVRANGRVLPLRSGDE